MTSPKYPKHPRLPPTHRVSKRALIRPPIPSPYRSAASPKVIWVRARTPFRSTVARVNALLEHARKREDGAAADERLLRRGRVGEKAGSKGRDGNDVVRGAKEGVFLKGAGRAVARVMEIGSWFLQRPEYTVRVRAGETSVVDDVVRVEGEEGPEGQERKEEGEDAEMEDVGNGEGDGGRAEMEGVEAAEGASAGGRALSETRIRSLNTLEVEIKLAA